MGRMSSPICPNLLSFLGQYNIMIVSLCVNVWFESWFQEKIIVLRIVLLFGHNYYTVRGDSLRRYWIERGHHG